MNYTCKECGKSKNSEESEWDYYLDGVICAECAEEQSEDLNERTIKEVIF